MKATTGETIAFARQVFAGPLEDRIKQLEARNAELVDVLNRLCRSLPSNISCNQFHHEFRDRHGCMGNCPPLGRYTEACIEAWESLQQEATQ